jgi:hypothetical protein
MAHHGPQRTQQRHPVYKLGGIGKCVIIRPNTAHGDPQHHPPHFAPSAQARHPEGSSRLLYPRQPLGGLISASPDGDTPGPQRSTKVRLARRGPPSPRLGRTASSPRPKGASVSQGSGAYHLRLARRRSPSPGFGRTASLSSPEGQIPSDLVEIGRRPGTGALNATCSACHSGRGTRLR